MSAAPLELRRLPAPARLGLSFLLLVVLGGLVASVAHLVLHHQNRDERPGLSLADLEGAYHGVRTTAPLLAALQRGHPEGLPEPDRAALASWLQGARVSEDYDNLELGDRAPAEVLDRHCLRCHARQAAEGGGIGKRLPLEYWDDVRVLALSRDVQPVAPEILVASTHTHALSMGALSLLLGLLALCSRWSRGLVGGLLLVSGVALFCDLGSWLLAAGTAALVPLIAISGALWMGATAALVGLLLLELWCPARAGAPDR